MPLLQDLRRREAKEPTRRDFDLQAFEQLAQSEAVSASDRLLARTAIWTAGRLAALRAMVRLIDPNHALSRDERIRAIVSLCNRETTVARIKFLQSVRSEVGPDKTFYVDRALGMKLELPGGGAFNIDEMVQSNVESATIPIKLLLAHAPREGSGAKTKVDWNEVATAFNVGVAYGSVEDQWDLVLWRGYRMLSDGLGTRTAVFAPSEHAQLDWQIQSIYRDQTLNFARTQMLARGVHSGEIPAEIFVGLREAKSIRKLGKRVTIGTGPVESLSSNSMIEFLALNIQIPIYYSEVAAAPAPGLPSVTLKLVIEAWRLLVSLGVIVNESLERIEFGRDGEVSQNQNTDVTQYLRVFKQDTLLEFLTNGLRVVPATAAAILEFFTFRGKNNQELWTQPFVPVGPGSLAPIIPCLIGSNVGRSVDRWMLQLGYDLSLRGDLFEQYIRERLSSLAIASEIRGQVQASAQSFKFRPLVGRSEQIDFVLRIGALVVVGEAKCSLRPTSEEMWFRHEELVCDAVAQVRRKAEAIKLNRAAFVSQIASSGIECPAEFEVLPMVMLNSPMHAGVMIDGVAIVDETIVEVFVRNELMQGAVLSATEETTSASIKKFYKCIEEVPGAAREYFAAPPQLDHIKRGLTWRTVPTPLAPGDIADRFIQRSRHVQVDVEGELVRTGLRPTSS